MKNDEEHMKLFGRQTREYLQTQHEDKTSELYFLNVSFVYTFYIEPFNFLQELAQDYLRWIRRIQVSVT